MKGKTTRLDLLKWSVRNGLYILNEAGSGCIMNKEFSCTRNKAFICNKPMSNLDGSIDVLANDSCIRPLCSFVVFDSKPKKVDLWHRLLGNKTLNDILKMYK